MSSNYSNAVLADSPIGYYRLGEASGSTAYDASGNVRDAIINGTVVPGIKGAIVKDLDTAMLFDGNNTGGGTGYIDVPASVTQGANVTVECWFKLTSITFTSYPRPIANDNVGSSKKGVEIGINAGGSGGVFANLGFTGSSIKVGGGGQLLIGVWYHVAVTYDGTTAILYLNGQNIAQNTPSLTLATGTFAYDIGRNPSYTNDYVPGAIDEVAFYSTALSATRILAHYNAGIYSAMSSSYDTFYTKCQIVKVYDSTGLFLDTIRDAPYLSCKENINSAADTVKFTLPRAIDAFDGAGQPGNKNTIVSGNIVQWWIYGSGIISSGLLKFQGIIDEISPKLDENGGESVEVTVTPYSQVLGDHGITSTVTFGTPGTASTYIDSASIFRAFFTGSYTDSTGNAVSVIDALTGKPYGDPYTMAPGSLTTTGQLAAFPFQNQKLIAALETVRSMNTADIFYRPNQDKTIFLGSIPSDPTHTLLLGQDISSIEYGISNVPRKNVIVVQGAGSVKATAFDAVSIAAIGQRIYLKTDTRITSNDMAQVIANGLLDQMNRETVRAKIKVPDYRGSPQTGLGYDIETFQVGQTVKILDVRAPSTSTVGTGDRWGSMVWGTGKWGAPAGTTIWGAFNWNEAPWSASVGSIFNTVNTIVSISYNYFYVELELGARAPTLSRALFDLEMRVQEATLLG